MASFYTCFKFKEYQPAELHCTHKYLGKISDEQLSQVVAIIDSYFTKNTVDSFAPTFNQEDWFGPNQDLRVLKADPSLHNYLLDLKNQLDIFRVENHPVYNPHVTNTQFKTINLPFYSYVLVKNGMVYKEWVLN